MSSLDDVSTCVVCGGGGRVIELLNIKKVCMCTSCAQKLVEHCKEEKSSSSISSADIDAISNSIEKIFISNDDNVDSDDNDELFKDPPPKEDCQICFLPMPNAQRDVICGAQPMYQPCCGKVICYGCMATSIEEMNEGNMKRWCPLIIFLFVLQSSKLADSSSCT